MADVELRPVKAAEDVSIKESDPSVAQSNEEESSGAAVVEDVESKPSVTAQPSANGKSKDEPTGGDPTSLSPEEEDDDAIEFVDKSFFLFEPTHPIRAFCISVITNRYFSWFILLVIILNAAFLAANDPLKGRKAGFNVVNYYADFVFLAIFIVEALLKIIAMGFVLHQYSYLRGASRCFSH